MALYGLRPEDDQALNQLLCGLRFKQPVLVSTQEPEQADIVLLDGDLQTGREFMASGQHPGEFLALHGQTKVFGSGLYLEKPIRARQLLNCINTLIDKIH